MLYSTIMQCNAFRSKMRSAYNGLLLVCDLSGRDWDETPPHLLYGANGIAALTFYGAGIALHR
jgi:hypothetical protein